MDGVLDESRLEGVQDVHLALRPRRVAELVSTTDEGALLERIRFHSQVWGGVGTVLVPSADGAIPDLYKLPLIQSDVDGLETGAFGDDLDPPNWLGSNFSAPHPALLIADNVDREGWYPFAAPVLEPEDPWRLIYAAYLGDLPEAPNTETLFPEFLYPTPPRFEQLIELDRPRVRGSLSDLLERGKRNRGVSVPRDLSLLRLASGLRLNNGYIRSEQVIPNPNATRVAAGPNIVVVFGDKPVADAALLWNLRHAHGLGHGLPIGVPKAELGKALNQLYGPGVRATFGFSGGRIFLTSASLTLKDVEETVGKADVDRFAIASDKDVLSLGFAPAIHGDQVATFAGGKALVSPTTLGTLRDLHRHGDQPQLHYSIRVEGAVVPMSKALRGDGWGPGFGANRLHGSVPSESLRRRGSLPVEWPTPWLRLRAVALDRGLEVAASQPGHAALALLRSLGGLESARWLANRAVVELLYRLAERSGMSWWKSRWTAARHTLSHLTDGEFEAMASSAGRDVPAIAPTGEGRQLAYSAFVKALEGKERAAANWIRWAEGRKLVVRGADVRCNHCNAKFWLPFSAIRADIGCPGCGSTVDHPFPPQQMQFTYGLGEVVRRVLEVDALDHLFSARYMWAQFRDRGLVGLHPGLEFREIGRSDVVAEADVLLLMHDGSLIPGEVKRTAAGLTDDAIARLAATEDRLTAPWSFFAVGQPARDFVGDPHSRAFREGPRPRFVISTDQTYESSPMWSVGQNPFEWLPNSAAEDADRSRTFVDSLRDRSPDEPWSAQEFRFLGTETGNG